MILLLELCCHILHYSKLALLVELLHSFMNLSNKYFEKLWIMTGCDDNGTSIKGY